MTTAEVIRIYKQAPSRSNQR